MRGAPTLLTTLFDHLPDPVYLIDPATARIVYCNRAANEHFGLSRAEMLARSLLHLHDELSDEAHWQKVVVAIRESGQHIHHARHRHPAGHRVPVEVHSRAFRHRGREYFLAVARPTATAPGAGQPDAAQSRRQLALEDAVDGLWDWDIRRQRLHFSPQWLQMLGYGPQDAPPEPASWSHNVHPEDLRRVRLVLREHLTGRRERFEAEYRMRNRNGHFLWVQDRGKVCERDARGRPLLMVGTTQNITERKLLELELQRRATHDGLTGLLNRRESEIVLATQLQLCHRLGLALSVCLFDIDHFKRINDLLGHLTGDLVLQRVAELVGGAIRAADHLFRWGGEEFLLVCADTDGETMARLCEKLRLRLEQAEWPTLSDLGRITASFGVASFPEQTSPHELLLAADSALYRAKRAGRNRVESAR